MQNKALWLIVFLIVGSILPGQAEKIRVVTRNVEPFSFEENGERKGFATDLWQRVAQKAGLEYDVQVVGTAQDMIDALKNHTADAAVGALSATAKREAIVDFSQPFYESGLQILTGELPQSEVHRRLFVADLCDAGRVAPRVAL